MSRAGRPEDDGNWDRLREETFVQRFWYEAEVTSTQELARDWAANNPGPNPHDEPLLVLAESQTAGRGRGRNRWWTGPGSLAFSLLLNPRSLIVRSESAPALPLSAPASLAAGTAIVEALTPLVTGPRLGLHWPNDVFAGDRKLCGILTERLADGRLLLGIGINVNNRLAEAPPELQEILTTLWELHNGPLDRTDVLVRVLRGLETTLRELLLTPAELGRRYDPLCLQRDRELVVDQGNETLLGRCLGIAPDGALRLWISDRERLIYSGTLRHAPGP